MRPKAGDKKSSLPELYITRALSNPEQLKGVQEDLVRGLGYHAILFSLDTLEIPLFKVSALPSFRDVKSHDDIYQLQAKLQEAIASIEPEVTVPVYFNSLSTLFVVNENEQIGIRLRNNYVPDNTAETFVDHYEGGQVDYMVHTAVQSVREVFPQDPIGPDHRGYINGRDRRMKAHEIFDYLALGIIDVETFAGNHERLRLLQTDPEAVLLEEGISLDYPKTLVFGAMRTQIRARRHHAVPAFV